MKTKNLLTKAVVLTVCLSLTGVATAGGPKGLPKGKGGKLGLPAVTDKLAGDLQREITGKSFVFSPQVAEHIRNYTFLGIKRKPAQKDLSFSNASQPTEEFGTESSFVSQRRIAFIPPEKQILSEATKEEQFYKREIDAAQNLYNLVSSVSVLDEETMRLISSSIRNDFKNDSLRKYLLDSFARKELPELAEDLRDYFDLDQNLEVAAFNYTRRHPGKQSLPVLRLRNNPFVDRTYKDMLGSFLRKSEITEKDFPVFQKVFLKAYHQYIERLETIQGVESIQLQVAYVRDLIARLNDFIDKNPEGTRPDWNGPEEEQALFLEIEWVQTHQTSNQFEPLLSYINELNEIWESAAPTYLSLEETLELYKEFVTATGAQYPSTELEKTPEEFLSFPKVRELWDNLTHLRIEGKLHWAQLSDIYKEAMAERTAAQGQAANPAQ